jgi:hypothetical protein
MSATDFVEVNITEQDNVTQAFNLVHRVPNSFQFNETIWVPNFPVPSGGLFLALPAIPTPFAYIKNIGKVNIGLSTSPLVTPNTPPPPPLPLEPVTILGPGGIFLLYAPNVGGGFIGAGLFAANVSGGLASIYLIAGSSSGGLVEFFLGA